MSSFKLWIYIISQIYSNVLIVNLLTFVVFQELESLFSDHLGRTPLTTPDCSQEENESGECDAIELSHGAVNDVVNGRVGQLIKMKIL